MNSPGNNIPQYLCRIKEIIDNKAGTERFIPSVKLLEKLGMTSARFRSVYSGRKEPNLSEIVALSQHFGISQIAELVSINPAWIVKQEVVSLKKGKPVIGAEITNRLVAKYGSAN